MAAKGAPRHVARAYAARYRREEGLSARRGGPSQHRVPAGAGSPGRALLRHFGGGARTRGLHGPAVGRLPRRRGLRERAARQRRTRQAGSPPQPSRMGACELVLRAVAARLQPIGFLYVHPFMGLFRPVVRPALGGKPRQKRQGNHAAARRGRYRSALAPADVPRRPRRQGLHPAALPEPEQGPAVPGRRAGQLGMAAGQGIRGSAQRRNPRLGCGPRA